MPKVTCCRLEEWGMISSRDGNFLLCLSFHTSSKVHPVSHPAGTVEKFFLKESGQIILFHVLPGLKIHETLVHIFLWINFCFLPYHTLNNYQFI
jgi:hypothetical protein